MIEGEKSALLAHLFDSMPLLPRTEKTARAHMNSVHAYLGFKTPCEPSLLDDSFQNMTAKAFVQCFPRGSEAWQIDSVRDCDIDSVDLCMPPFHGCISAAVVEVLLPTHSAALLCVGFSSAFSFPQVIDGVGCFGNRWMFFAIIIYVCNRSHLPLKHSLQLALLWPFPAAP